MTHDSEADSWFIPGRLISATRVQLVVTQTKGIRSERSTIDVYASPGATADEFPPGFAEFAAARERGIALAGGARTRSEQGQDCI